MGMEQSRREHLGVLGIAIAGGLAGCSGGDDGSTDGTGDGDSDDNETGNGDPGDDQNGDGDASNDQKGDGDAGDDQNGTTEGEVYSFEVTDQSTDGSFVTIDEFHAGHDSYIVVTSMHGEELATSPVLAGDEVHEDMTLLLDPPVEMEHTLKAVAYREDGTPYQKDGEVVTRMADLTLTDAGDGDDGGTSALFSISDLDPVEPTIAEPGNRVTVSATVTNTGDNAGTQEVVFTVDGTIQDSETVSLDGGDSASVSFEMETAGFEPGSSSVFEISSDDSSQSGVVTVESAD